MENTRKTIKLFVRDNTTQTGGHYKSYSSVDKNGEWYKVVKTDNCKDLPDKSCLIGLIDKKFDIKKNVKRKDKNGNYKLNSRDEIITENIIWLDDYNYEGEIEREVYNDEDLPF